MNSKTLLLRQVHPSFIGEGFVSSQTFAPFPKDEGLLSVYDGDLIEVRAAHVHYTEVLRLQLAGVWGVLCAEADEINLPNRPDPLEDFAQHAVIDFTGHPTKAARKLAKKLRDFAVVRGCLYAPSE